MVELRKHPQPATIKLASRITVCFWVHNNSFRVCSWQQSYFRSHWQGNSGVFFKTQWEAMGTHILYYRVLFEVVCILSVHSTAVQWTLEFTHGLQYFWKRCRWVYRGRKLQQARSAPYSAMLLWLFVINTENPLLLSAYSSWKQLALVTGTAHLHKSAPWVQTCGSAGICLWPKPRRTIPE